MQHGFGESEISWTTTGKANIILDNLIEMGKIKPFTLVMSDGMVQEKVGSEERLNHVLLERMLVEEIIPMAEKKYQFTGMINSYSGSIVVFLLNTNIDKNSLQIYKNLGFFL